MTNTQRIEFIDLAKGVCILLVVLQHIGLDVNFLGMVSMRMPLYFVLSGLFFKDYGGFREFLIKKTNRLLIPFIFFYLLGYAIYYGVNWIFPNDAIYGAYNPNMILRVFNGKLRNYFNGPIWFLLALFWANLMFCVIALRIKKEWMRALIVVLIGAGGYYLGQQHIFLPFLIDISCSALPFFYLGYILRKSPLLYPNSLDKYNLLIAATLYLIAATVDYCCGCPRIWFHYNTFYGNVGLAVLISGTSVGAVLFLCKAVGRLPLISYIGHYSIIFLCLHHLIYRHLYFIFDESLMINRYIVAILTIAICLFFVPLCRKYIPWFVAQKDLIRQ